MNDHLLLSSPCSMLPATTLLDKKGGQLHMTSSKCVESGGCTSVAGMSFCRGVSGIGVGGTVPTAFTYMAEVSEPRTRGKLMVCSPASYSCFPVAIPFAFSLTSSFHANQPLVPGLLG